MSPAQPPSSERPSPRALAQKVVQSHGRELPLRIGTRASPLARVQTRSFVTLLTEACPVLGMADLFEEVVIRTTGDKVQDRPLADIGGKGLFAKEIHEALLDERIDFAVHSLKDLETALPLGIVLALVLPREDPRDALVLGPACGAPNEDDPFACLPQGATIGTASVRRQSQLLAARPDLRIGLLRGNVQTRMDRVRDGHFAATLLALAGLRRLGLAEAANLVIPPSAMLPAACQGIVGVTMRTRDRGLIDQLQAVDHGPTRIAATAERALLAELDGSCRTPIGAYTTVLPGGRIRLEGLVARADGSFLLRREIEGLTEDAARLGRALGAELRADSPADVFG